jgi:hypothetical protein
MEKTMDLKKENNTLQKQTTHLKAKSLYTLILLILNTFLISTNGKCQENDNVSVSELNGIWRNSKYTSNYYLFHNGKYLFFIEDDPTLSYGIYGFYPNSVTVENLKNISLNKTQLDQYKLGFASNNGGVIGYEFEIGERLLNLYNQNDFFYEKLYVLPQKIVAQVRAIAKEKKLNMDNFIYSEETIGVAKAAIYTAPNVKSKMYLVKGDTVKITEENGKWVKIQYKGKKLIEGWLRKQDL